MIPATVLIAFLLGQPGKPGDNGPVGNRGPEGLRGEQGLTGPIGIPGDDAIGMLQLAVEC